MKILVGMSGGIDSSVAAYLLTQQGHDVAAVTMTIWSNRDHLERPQGSTGCFAPDKSEDIKRIGEFCSQLGIEHTVLELSDRFEELVLKNFKAEYLGGRTPNPCVWCNQRIKFGAMIDYAYESGLVFDTFATGHYAKIVEHDGRLAVGRGRDTRKDQSYFLYRLSQEQLGRTLFPLGEMTKDEVRAIDVELGFLREDQSESQDFYDGDYTDLLEVEKRPGKIINTAGQVLGGHDGIFHYTIGQRKGLGIASDRPLYVLALDAEKNEVIVGYREETEQTTVVASDVVWQGASSLEGEVEVEAKIRSASRAVRALASQNDDGTIRAIFPNGVKAAAVGQSMVLYKDDRILCGGIIEEAF